MAEALGVSRSTICRDLAAIFGPWTGPPPRVGGIRNQQPGADRRPLSETDMIATLEVLCSDGTGARPVPSLTRGLRQLADAVGRPQPINSCFCPIAEVVEAVHAAGLLRAPRPELAVNVFFYSELVPDLADRLRDLAYEAAVESPERRRAVRAVVEEARRLGLLN